MVNFNVIDSYKSTASEATAVDRIVYSDQMDKLPAKLRSVAEAHGFNGAVAKTLVIPSASSGKVEVLVGLGASTSVTLNEVRKAAGAFAKAVKGHQHVATKLAAIGKRLKSNQTVEAVVEGISLASYRYEARKGLAYESKPEIETVDIVTKAAGAEEAIKSGTRLGTSVSLARDLGNEPGGHLYPEAFANVAIDIAASSGLEIEVWDKKKVTEEKLGGLLAVNQGSEYEPRLVKLTYSPADASDHVVLVGKGITFDSGGLSLKTPKGMQTMKIDMAGGAAVLAAMSNLSVLGCKTKVTGIIPLTDNMTGGFAQRPGDVFTARNGKTVEVLNTDAEGRLVLADGLSLASELEPDAIIDVATLTGSASVALGTSYAAVMGTDNKVTKKVIASSKSAGEKMWQLPLPSEYRSQLDSFVADVKNIGSGSYGGTLVAGLFLKEFVEGAPWVHIDLGLSAFSESAKGLNPKGATGFGVRTLTHVLCNW